MTHFFKVAPKQVREIEDLQTMGVINEKKALEMKVDKEKKQEQV